MINTQLIADNVLTTNVTRITVVTDEGIVFERYDAFKNGVTLSLQDDGRTLKVFPAGEGE